MGKPHDQHHASKHDSNAKSMAETSMTLKVLIHCEGCRRKLKRIIRCVDGVESVVIEPQTGKVTVSGKGVDSRDVLQSLHEAGKFAEVWHAGGGKLPLLNQPHNLMNSGNNKPNNFNKPSNFNSNLKDDSLMNMGNSMKAAGWEKPSLENSKSFNVKEKGNENAGLAASGFGAANFNGVKMDLPQFGAQNPHFPSGDFPRGGHFEKQTLPSNNMGIMSRSVAPMPAIYSGETSQGHLQTAEYTGADYATHLFSDENANNCSIM